MIVKNKNGNIYGKEPFFNVREISTLREMLDGSVSMFPDRTAFMQKYDNNSPYTKISYSKFGKDVYAFAEGLIELGLKDRKIALISENRYEWSVAYMAVVCGVGTIVPLDKELPENEIINLTEFAECSAVIISSAVLKKTPSLAESGLKLICIENEFDGILNAGKNRIVSGSVVFKNAQIKPEDVNIILFTSGTCSMPKGVMLSHKNICSCIMNICSVFKIDMHDRVFSLLPLHHTYECTCGFLCEIYVGASIAYCRGLRYILKNLQESSPTMFFCVPMVLESIYKVLNKTIDKNGQRKKVELGLKLSRILKKAGIDIRRKLFGEIIERFGGKLKMFLVGAAPVDPKIMQFFTDIGITSIQGYGMTECSPIITENRASHYRNESVGMPLPELEIKICEKNSDDIGEIAVKGDNVMVGYYKNPEETKKVIRDGWFYTGDMGYYKNGFLYLTGRKKNLIITSNGKNVFPEELETEINKSDYVSESMVYSDNNIICAQIIPDMQNFPENASDDDVEEKIKEEVKTLNERLPNYKNIVKIIIRSEPFKKTTTQKIKRDANL